MDAAMQKSCKPAMLGRIWHASRRALNLEHHPSHQFACSQWQTSPHPSTTYIIYRWLVLITVISIGVASFACQRLPRKYDGPKVELNYFKWFIYFTNWGFLLITIQAGLALAVVHRYRRQKGSIRVWAKDSRKGILIGRGKSTGSKSYNGTVNLEQWKKICSKDPSSSPHSQTCEEDEMPIPVSRRARTPLLCRAYWLLQNIATDLAFVISLVYWTLVYDPNIHEVNALNVLVHGGNSLLMIVELGVTAHPVRAAHALYSAGAGLAYGLFSALYWAMGGTDRVGLPAIYPALDWNKPGSAVGFVSLCAVVLVFAHALATCLAASRARVGQRLRPARTQADRFTLPTH